MSENVEIGMNDNVDPGSSSCALVTLPNGYVDAEGNLIKDVMITEMTGADEDILASKKGDAAYKLQKVLENCIKFVGQYSKDNSNWTDVITSLVLQDRMYLLVQLRIISLGSEFSYKTKCPNCEKESSQTVNLEDFKFSGLPDPMMRKYEGELPRSKQKYVCIIHTGKEDMRQKPNEEDNVLTNMIASRLKELNGKPATATTVKALPTMDRSFLRDQIKKHEGEMDTSCEITCPHCRHEFVENASIGHPNFFFPSEM